MQSFYYFIEVAVTRQESGLSCISVLGVSILPLFTILIFDFGMVPVAWYFCFSFYCSSHCWSLLMQYLSNLSIIFRVPLAIKNVANKGVSRREEEHC